MPPLSSDSTTQTAAITSTGKVADAPLSAIYGMVQTQALVVSMKEIFGWLLISALASLLMVSVSYSTVRPWAIFPKWSTIRRVRRHSVRTFSSVS